MGTARAVWRPFVRDWVIFAPAAVWLALLVSIFLGVDVWRASLATGALLTYAIALSWAFVDNLDLSHWETSSPLGKCLAFIVPNVPHVLTLIATVLLAIILIGDAIEEEFRTSESSEIIGFLGAANDSVILTGYILSAVALCIAIVGLVQTPRSGPNEGGL